MFPIVDLPPAHLSEPTNQGFHPWPIRLLVSIAAAALLPIAFLSVSQAAETYQMIAKWGSYGGGTSQFDYPENVAVDPGSGNVYVTDSGNNRVQKFDANGVYLGQWGSYGSGNGQFKWPSAAAVDGSGNVLVTDADNHRVQKFNSSGGYLSQWGGPGTGNGKFNFPAGIALDTTGTIYVVDSKNQRVQKFNSSGGYLGQWGSYGSNNGELSYPDGIAIDTSNNVYLSDTNNDRVQKFNTNGGYVSKWSGLNYPEGIAVDTAGNVFVADRNAHRIQKFNSSGGLITFWGSNGSADGNFFYPRGVAVDASGNVFVADTLNDRVQKFGIPGSTPPVTTLTTNPATANGDNGWFKTSPQVTLTRNEAGSTFYQWDTTATWTTYAGPFSAPQGQSALYYYSRDTDSNTETTRSRLFKTDGAAPGNPTNIAAPGNPTNTPTRDRTIEISFSGATDPISGIDGYSITWSNSAGTLPDEVKEMEEIDNSTTSGSLADGSWWFHLRTKDNAGNWASTVHAGPYVVDNSPPNTTAPTDPTGPNGDNGWFKSAPEITLTRNEAGSTFYRWDTTATWTTYAGPFSAPQGQSTLYFFSTDTAGNTETARELSLKVDSGLPLSPPETTSTSHRIGEKSANATVTIAFSGATDAVSGVAGYAYSWTRDASAAPPATVDLPAGGGPTETVAASLADGDWWFNLATLDAAGNRAASLHIGPYIVETRPPVTTLNVAGPGAGGWYTSTPEVTLSADESAAVYYFWNTGPPQIYTDPLEPPQGINTLSYFAVDSFGNTETIRNAEFKIDTIAPVNPLVTRLSSAAGAWQRSPYIGASLDGASDGGSGVAGYSLSFSQNTPALPDTVSDLPAGAGLATSPALPDGVWYLNLRTLDNAGNWTSAVHAGPFNIDTIAPTAKIRSPRQARRRTFAVVWSGLDPAPASGIASYIVQYRIGARGKWRPWKRSTLSVKAKFTGLPGKTYYFRARAKDTAGNLGAWSKKVRTIVPN